MKLIICKNYDEMSKAAAKIIAGVITLKPDCILGLATGSTPVGMYKYLVEWNKAGEIDFSKVKTYNLDEYYPISPDNDQSYRYFMNDNLFCHVNIDMANTHVLNGLAEDADAECAAYDKAVAAAGGIDIQVLGIGKNGHIGFNEPAEKMPLATHKVRLTDSTIAANARFFASEDDVPRHALTVGLGPIMEARRILLLVSGKNKHEASAGLLEGVVTTANPSTMLHFHKDVTVICDEEAYNG